MVTVDAAAASGPTAHLFGRQAKTTPKTVVNGVLACHADGCAATGRPVIAKKLR
jgi:hypothetical protein